MQIREPKHQLIYVSLVKTIRQNARDENSQLLSLHQIIHHQLGNNLSLSDFRE